MAIEKNFLWEFKLVGCNSSYVQEPVEINRDQAHKIYQVLRQRATVFKVKGARKVKDIQVGVDLTGNKENIFYNRNQGYNKDIGDIDKYLTEVDNG